VVSGVKNEFSGVNVSLAVKYRPQSFESICGQTSVRKILQHQIETNTVKHAYLFCGSAGCGKTSSARIFANEINHGQGEPIELDMASNNGVDDVRNIIQQAQTQSLDSEYRVFICDEAHAVTPNGWAAFLKTLEEPPKKSIFIFCTTNPEKIPSTILSRVQRYDFHRLSQHAIVERLRYIIDSENGVKSAPVGEKRESVSTEEQNANTDGFGALDLPFKIE